MCKKFHRYQSWVFFYFYPRTQVPLRYSSFLFSKSLHRNLIRNLRGYSSHFQFFQVLQRKKRMNLVRTVAFCLATEGFFEDQQLMT